MKKFWVSLAIISGLITIVILCTSSSSSIYEVSLKQIDSNRQNGALLIDVRTEQEYTQEHAEGAINLPLADIQSGKEPSVSKDKIVYVYCQSGKRAAEAKSILERAGYKHVISVISLNNWVALGGKVIEPETACDTDKSKC